MILAKNYETVFKFVKGMPRILMVLISTIKLHDDHYQTEPNLSIFPKKDLIKNVSSFCSLIPSATDLQCHVFPFEKLLLNVRLCRLTAFLMTSDMTSSPRNGVVELG